MSRHPPAEPAPPPPVSRRDGGGASDQRCAAGVALPPAPAQPVSSARPQVLPQPLRWLLSTQRPGPAAAAAVVAVAALCSWPCSVKAHDWFCAPVLLHGRTRASQAVVEVAPAGASLATPVARTATTTPLRPNICLGAAAGARGAWPGAGCVRCMLLALEHPADRLLNDKTNKSGSHSLDK
jgi:hypothetical protein